MPGTLQRQMLKLMPHSVTTRHSASLYPLQAERSLPSLGPVIGVDHHEHDYHSCDDTREADHARLVPDRRVVCDVGHQPTHPLGRLPVAGVFCMMPPGAPSEVSRAEKFAPNAVELAPLNW